MIIVRYTASIRPINSRARRARRARAAAKAAVAKVVVATATIATNGVPARIAAQGTGPLSSSTGAGRLVQCAFLAQAPRIQLAA